jgi:glycosyltransferase involved in cell wall biosynthesis
MTVATLTRVVVVICTHNPDENRLSRVIDSVLSNRNVPYRVVLIENASSNTEYLSGLNHYPIEILMENRIGLAFAKHTGMLQQKKNELLVFVDDDNLLNNDYLVKALQFANASKDIGVFGGQTRPAPNLNCPKWKEPFLPYLGIRTFKQSVIVRDASLHWNVAQPIGAGMCIRPEVTRYILKKSELKNFFLLGRIGKRTGSGEDAFIANQSVHLTLKWALKKDLILIHEINTDRLRVRYLVRLFYNYGYSDVLLNLANATPPPYPYPRNLINALMLYVYFAKKGRSGVIIGLRQMGIYIASRKFTSLNDTLG